MDFKENKNDKTPRTDAAASINSFAWLQFESEKLERELNTATVNEAIAENKVHILEKELEKANNRIKRLEDIIEKASKHFRIAGPNAFTAYEMADVLKEVKL
jgi:hypothetical protein